MISIKALNKRNRGKTVASFNFLVGDSKKGTLKGLKKVNHEGDGH